ncbi:MAG: hypothetical protein AB8G23_05490 [Myxococcota bacterium]
MFKKTVLLLAASASIFATAAQASDGVAEINHTCATATGCFPGDVPGYPVTIGSNSPTSFRLTGNLLLPNENTDGIRVAATENGVSIDLGGFTIAGPTRCSQNATTKETTCNRQGGGRGIYAATGSSAGVTVRNGSIYGMGNAGINIVRRGALVQDVRVTDCGGEGVILVDGSIVERVSVEDVRLFGIRVGSNGLIRNSTVRSAREGISIGNAGRVEGSTSSNNFFSGFNGGESSSFVGNTSEFNAQHGIRTPGDGGLVKNNTINGNAFDGINAGALAMIESNSIRNSGDRGIQTGSGGIISGNTVSGSASDGIYATDGTVVRGNSVFENGTDAQDDGIHCTLGCMAQANTLRANAGYGLRFDTGSSVYTQNAIGANNLAGTVVNGRDGGSNVCGTMLNCP